MHSLFLRVQSVVILQFSLQLVEQTGLDPASDLFEILLHVRGCRLSHMPYGSWVVACGNAQVVHQAVHVIVQRLEVYDQVIIDSTRKAELQKRHKVLIVRTQRKLGHKFDEVLKRRMDVLGVILSRNPILQPLVIVEVQEISLQSVWEFLPLANVKGLLQLVLVRTEQSLHGVTHNGKLEVVL